MHGRDRNNEKMAWTRNGQPRKQDKERHRRVSWDPTAGPAFRLRLPPSRSLRGSFLRGRGGTTGTQRSPAALPGSPSRACAVARAAAGSTGPLAAASPAGAVPATGAPPSPTGLPHALQRTQPQVSCVQPSGAPWAPCPQPGSSLPPCPHRTWSTTCSALATTSHPLRKDRAPGLESRGTRDEGLSSAAPWVGTETCSVLKSRMTESERRMKQRTLPSAGLLPKGLPKVKAGSGQRPEPRTPSMDPTPAQTLGPGRRPCHL